MCVCSQFSEAIWLCVYVHIVAEMMQVKLLLLCSHYQIRTIVWWWKSVEKLWWWWKNIEHEKHVGGMSNDSEWEASESLYIEKLLNWLIIHQCSYTKVCIYSFLPITHENNWDHIYGDKRDTIYGMRNLFSSHLDIKVHSIKSTAENWFISSTSTSSVSFQLSFHYFSYGKWF